MPSSASGKNRSTIEQCKRVYKVERAVLDEREYCTAVFLDINQALDKVSLASTPHVQT